MISLEKGQKISLVKSSSSLGEILINLNWNSKKKGLFFKSNNIDLDLGCLYELKDGSKGCVQALGNNFGSLVNPPYAALDGDDRTGANKAGENLRINGDMVSQIKRILVYTFIYDGIANWKDAESVVTIKYPNAEDIVVKMDSFDSRNTMCGLVLFENVNDTTFSVEKLIQFYPGHRDLDAAFGWGMTWHTARK